MAEGGGVNVKNTLPQRGKVKSIRQEWAVHEDGAIAYQLQNEEIDRHYGMNRFNRRTVREDIPIAKVVQDDEEMQQQNERFTQLQALRAQAEEDERVAKQMLEQEQLQQEAHRVATELTDEEFARAVQEKEKKRYERHLEKKKLQKLKQERAEIEQSLQQKTEEAGLLPPTGSPNTTVENVVEGSQATRVTHRGQIEDDGDFSDFYNLPPNIDPSHRQVLQEIQDEELAKLLQDQEHKRSKAEVDRAKLREIEEQDKRLAQIIQEQEKIKLRKAKQKKKQQDEAKKAQQQVQRPPALPPRNSEHDHRRYRRNSFIMSMENGPSDGEGGSSPIEGQDGYVTAFQVSAEQRLSQQASVGSRSSGAHSDTGPNVLNNSRSAGSQPKDITHARNLRQTVPKVPNTNQPSSRRPLPDYPGPPIPSQDMPDVERWLASQPPDATRGRLRSDEPDHLPESPPGSYHSDDAFPYGSPRHNMSVDQSSHYAVSAPFNFNNIAAAIDPTYTPRDSDRTPAGSHVTRAIPHEVCTEIEWEPELHGSLRKGSLSRLHATSTCNGFPDRTVSTSSSRGDGYHDDGPGVISPFVPVQGQRRGPDKGRKSKRPESSSNDKNKNNCKQQ